jgi:hypothetical protein
MIRILAGASPVLRNVKPSIGGVCVWALGHWGGFQQFRVCSKIKKSKGAPLPHYHLGRRQDSGQFLQPFVSQAERILVAGGGLSGVGREATALLEQEDTFS